MTLLEQLALIYVSASVFYYVFAVFRDFYFIQRSADIDSLIKNRDDILKVQKDCEASLQIEVSNHDSLKKKAYELENENGKLRDQITKIQQQLS